MSTITCAIQIGTSRIMAVAARRDEQGTLEVLAIESVPTNSAVRHGSVVGSTQTALHLKTLVHKLNNRIRTQMPSHGQITGAYVGIGGMTMHTVAEHPATDRWDVIATSELADGKVQYVVADPRLRQGIQAAMDRSGLKLLGLYAQPDATMQLVTADERQRGCVLVDMGAGTTTVQVFTAGERRRLAVIPLGGDAVTADISHENGSTLADAENLKMQWDSDNRVVRCRYEEIAQNILHQIECCGIRAQQLEAGCILTGGAALQRGLTSLISRRLNIARIEIRGFMEPSFLGSERKPQMANLLALLHHCAAGSAIEAPKAKPQQDVKPETPRAQPAKPAHEVPDTPSAPGADKSQEESPLLNDKTNRFSRFFNDLFSGIDE